MKKGYIYIVLCAFIFSTMELAGKLVAGSLSPIQVTFMRFLIGSVMLLPLAANDLRRKSIRLEIGDYVYFFVLGSLCIPISMVLHQLSVVHTQASTAAIVFSINPLFTLPFAFFILGEKIEKKMVTALSVSLAGVVCIFNPFAVSYDIRGILLALASALTFALYTVLSKSRLSKYGGFIFNFFTFAAGEIVLFAVLFANGTPVFSSITPENLPVIIYMGIVITGLGYIFFLEAIKLTSPVTASSVFFIKPALAPLLSMAFLGERISLNVAIGMLLIIAGSVMSYRARAS